MTNSIFLAQLLNSAAEMIEEQGDQLLQDCGLDIPSRFFSLLLLIQDLQPVSGSVLARNLQRSHQLVSHRLKSLEKLKIIRSRSNLRDERQSLIILTSNGEKIATDLANIADQAAPVFDALYAEIDVDFIAALDRLKTTLRTKTISQRFEEQNAFSRVTVAKPKKSVRKNLE